MIYSSRTNKFWPPKDDYQLRKRWRKSKTIQTSNRQISSLKLKRLFILKNWGHCKQRSNYGISTFEMFVSIRKRGKGIRGKKGKKTQAFQKSSSNELISWSMIRVSSSSKTFVTCIFYSELAGTRMCEFVGLFPQTQFVEFAKLSFPKFHKLNSTKLLCGKCNSLDWMF